MASDDLDPPQETNESGTSQEGSESPVEVETSSGNGVSEAERLQPSHDDSGAVNGTNTSSDLRSIPYNELPNNIEAEQSLLGAILINNNAYERVSDVLNPEHFYEPLHQRIFHIVSTLISRGQLASPVTLKPYFETDPTIQDVGGTGYLVRLAGAAPTVINAPEYARIVFELYQRRSLVEIGQDVVNSALDVDLDTGPSEQIAEAEQRLYSLAEHGLYEGGFISFDEAAQQSVRITSEACQREGGLSGIGTDFIDLDHKLGGLHESDLIILAGRPSMGKTALATNIAFNVAKAYQQGENPDGSPRRERGGIVGFYSLEMSSEQLATRILSEQSQIPSHRLRKGDITEEEFRAYVEAHQTLTSLPLYIDDTGGLSIAALAARARRLQRQQGLDLLVVDYLQLVTTSGSRRNDGRVQEVSEVTQGLKALAKELNIPIIALSQLSRKVEDRDDKRPQLADLRESGSIEQDADVVMFVYREEYYLERIKPPEDDLQRMEAWMLEIKKVHGLAELIIGKQRHGPTGTVELQFEANITRFGNKSDQDYPTEPSY